MNQLVTKEAAISFTSGSHQLLGIAHQSEQAVKTGVLVVVGGPQYRVGSHRQFVQLSRALAQQQIPSFRFDYTGMGDSQGEKKAFHQICDDIKVACDTAINTLGVEQLVIWGLCDAASAAMIYAHQDNRVKGIVILNPWLRSDAAMGKTMLKYYYVQRLLSKEFWQKLLTGKVNVASSIGDAKGFVKDSVSEQQNSQDAYQSRMQSGLAAFSGRVCLILSGVDLTAKEFEQQALSSKAWKKLRSKQTELHRIERADHTFSSHAFKREVEQITLDFVRGLNQ
ncbi:hydrolase 1, exosortase A system-associated [Aliiglaciecola litoralis]|uniref:Hydrolase 1, exosortase A system-associated n=1 Tax=Aliiglaciecola litoralis TaxID=582857 RepID=A0ABN1LJU3_9ALTE